MLTKEPPELIHQKRNISNQVASGFRIESETAKALVPFLTGIQYFTRAHGVVSFIKITQILRSMLKVLRNEAEDLKSTF